MNKKTLIYSCKIAGILGQQEIYLEKDQRKVKRIAWNKIFNTKS